MIISEIINEKLCIGCGFCAGVCTQSCITMTWSRSSTWLPMIDVSKCNNCGLCVRVCPNFPESLKAVGYESITQRENYGLSDEKDNEFYITYTNTDDERLSSASGGSTTRLLSYLLESRKVDFVVAAKSKAAKIGEPHFEAVICHTPEEVKSCSSSVYGPLRYDLVLKEIENKKERCAITVLPCIQRAIKNLPEKWRRHIHFTIGLICSHNVTDQFGDFMAHRHKIQRNESFTINYRDKKGITDANHFNTCFKLDNGREIRTPRMNNGFSPAWRNYWFAQECCLYCPDFYNSNSDISVKDAWGKMSFDPQGISLCIVRNEKIKEALNKLKLKNSIFIEACGAELIRDSQNSTAVYKQVDFIHRWQKHNLLKQYVSGITKKPAENKAAVKDYREKLRNIRLSKSIFQGSSYLGYLILVLIDKLQYTAKNLLKKHFPILLRLTLYFYSYCLLLTKWGMPSKNINKDPLRILITGGYGYKNVGDEAQLGANINRWKKLIPGGKIQVFSPNPDYTIKHHKVESIRAPRLIWFHSDRNADYAKSNYRFRRRFFVIRSRMLISVYLMKIWLPALLCKPSEYQLLREIRNADVLHVSGGGFLTGMTRSRLWENCLLMHLCHLLGTQVILTGQSIGVFKNKTDRKLAKWGLEHARLIYLRDKRFSEMEVNALGIIGPHIRSLFDDALFCERSAKKEVNDVLRINGIDLMRPFVIANFHHWGQSSETRTMSSIRFAESCDYITEVTKAQIIFIPMLPSDELPEQSVINNMKEKATLLKYDYDYRIARGIISQSKLVFTMKHHPIIFAYGEGVPVISVTLDDYYYHKNKGAMDLVQQGNFCIEYKTFCDSNQTNTLIKQAWKQREDNIAKIKKWVCSNRKMEIEAIKIFVRDNSRPAN